MSRYFLKTTPLLLVISIISLLSCMKEEQEAPGDTKDIAVSLEDTQVKTVFDPSHTSVLWEEGDCIGIGLKCTDKAGDD